MNILLVTNRYPRDDEDPASPFVPDFANALTALGARVIISTPQYGPPSDTRSEHVHRFVFEPTADETPIGSWNILRPRTWRRIHRFVAAGEQAVDDLVVRYAIDHILALWALPSGWFARYAARKRQVPYSVWCLGSDINRWARRPVFGRITRHILRKAEFVFADGFALARAARRLSHRPCRFLPSFRVLTSPFSTEVGRRDGRQYFLYAGRLHRDKGVYDLLSAYQQANLAAAGYDLVFIGDGPELRHLQDIAEGTTSAANIKILGRVAGPVLAGYYHGARAVVIPSRSDSLPLVFSEAVQSGCPVVAYNTGDLGLFIRRFNVGRVVAPGHVSALARAMVQCAAEKKMDPRGAATMLDVLNPARAARKFLAAIGTRAHPPGPRDTAAIRELSLDTEL